MNQRIKELYDHAIATVSNNTQTNDLNRTVAEKFAELLINDCIAVVEKTPKHCAFTTFQEGLVECTIKMAVEQLQKHYKE
jgi:hypothetical protein